MRYEFAIMPIGGWVLLRSVGTWKWQLFRLHATIPSAAV